MEVLKLDDNVMQQFVAFLKTQYPKASFGPDDPEPEVVVDKRLSMAADAIVEVKQEEAPELTFKERQAKLAAMMAKKAAGPPPP